MTGIAPLRSLVEQAAVDAGRLRSAHGYQYGVYGITLRSEFALPLLKSSSSTSHVTITVGGDATFRDALRHIAVDDSWRIIAGLPDGSTYVRWKTVGEYVVSVDGRAVMCRAFDGATAESFQVYLLGQALSFALVKIGLEPLHATAVVVDGTAIAFLGDSFVGKSTLAATFLRGGFRLLTDDQLVVSESEGGPLIAHPGPPRLKIHGRTARRLRGRGAWLSAMNPGDPKWILGLDAREACSEAVPLRAIYVLGKSREAFRKQRVRIEPLSARAALVELIGSTFNSRVVGADRLTRNFRALTSIVASVPVRRLVYPRDLDRVAEVPQAILLDLAERV